ncbi:MAG: hypothetical protein IPJ79_01150 [Bacteroidetes bacterium]|nr:hypothetical protein [Bacteroidota bacterium]
MFAASFAYKDEPNLWIYNLGVPIQLLLIVIIYHQLLASTIFKKYLRIGYFVFFILLCVDLLFIQKFNVFNTYVFIPAYLCIAFVSFIYLKMQWRIIPNRLTKISSFGLAVQHFQLYGSGSVYCFALHGLGLVSLFGIKCII